LPTKALEKKMGICVGFSIKKSISGGLIGDDLINNAMMLTSAGADVRMSQVHFSV